MTRLRTAALFVAAVAGGYAALALIDGQPSDFGESAAVCAGSLIASGLIARVDGRRRQAMARGRAGVWQRRDRQAAITAGQQCALCGGAGQKHSESTRFVDQRPTRLCAACAPTFNPEPT